MHMFRYLLLAAVALPTLAHAQPINPPPTVSNFGSIVATGTLTVAATTISGFNGNIGGALPVISNYQGGGLRGIVMPGELVWARLPHAVNDYTDFQFDRNLTALGSGGTISNINAAVTIQTTQVAGIGTREWNLRSTCTTSSTVTGALCTSGEMQAFRTAGTAIIIGLIAGAQDAIDAVSSTGKQVVGFEADVGANLADDGVNASMYGGVGIRVGLDVVGMRATPADTGQTQIAAGVWVGTGSAGTVADVHINYGQTYGTSVGTQSFNVFDARGTVAPTGSSNPVIALNMTAGQVVELNGGAALDSPPSRSLLYTSSLLSYQVSGVTKFAVSDTGVLSSAGTVGVVCSGSPTGSFATVGGIVTHC